MKFVVYREVFYEFIVNWDKILAQIAAFDSILMIILLQLLRFKIHAQYIQIRGRHCEQRHYRCPTRRTPRSLEKP